MPIINPKNKTVDTLLQKCGPLFTQEFSQSLVNIDGSLDSFFDFLLQSKTSYESDEGKTEQLYYLLIADTWDAFPDDRINTANDNKNKTLLMRTLSYPGKTDEHTVLLALRLSLPEGIDLKCEGHVNLEHYAIVVIIEQKLLQSLEIILDKAGEESLKAAKEAFIGRNPKKRIFKDSEVIRKEYSEEEISKYMLIINKRLKQIDAQKKWNRVALSIRRKKLQTPRRRLISYSAPPPPPTTPVKAAASELTPESPRKHPGQAASSKIDAFTDSPRAEDSSGPGKKI